jgi:hypothetical protein
LDKGEDTWKPKSGKPPTSYEENGKTFSLITTTSPEAAKPQVKALREQGHEITALPVKGGNVAIYGVRVQKPDAMDQYHERQRKEEEKAQVKGISENAAQEIWLKRLAEHDDAIVRNVEDKYRNPVPPMPRDPTTGKTRIATLEERETAKVYRKTKDTEKSAPKGSVRIM